MKHAAFRRIYDLDRLIRSGKFTSAEKVAKEFGVTRRTIERDLAELRDDLGAELVYDRSTGAYGYAGKPLTLPAQWLTEKEIAIVLIAERALRLHTGLSFHKEIHPVFNKFLDPIRHDRKAMRNIVDLCKSVAFHRPFELTRDVQAEFSAVLDAIMNSQRLSIDYEAAGKKRIPREIEPFVLLNNGGDWYAVGRNAGEKEVKTFALDRLYDPKPVDRYFAVPREFKIEEFLKKSFGRMGGGEGATVSLEISGDAVAWIGRNRWHPSQTTVKKKNGNLLLTVTCPMNDALVRWILQMGRNVRVVLPQRLRARVADEAVRLARNNGA